MTPSKNNAQKKSSSLIAPSLLSADFTRLGEEVSSLEKAGADWLHLDIMDGHFVPNLTFGPMIVKAIRPLTKLPFDCHLMVSNPNELIQEFIEVGANSITVHVETTAHLHRVLTQIKSAGCKAGVSLNPATHLSAIEEVLNLVDLVLVMSVNPGFGGQKFISESVSKVKRLAEMRGDRPFLIEVDGGVQKSNIGILRDAGADVFVAGSAIFSFPDRAQGIGELREGLRA
jgi:ribulose-phosphate 3-epimerase